MNENQGEIRVQVPLSAETVAKLDELAALMNVGRGRMAAMLLEEGVKDNEWLIRRLVSPLRALVEKWRDKGGGRKGKGSL